MKSLKKKEFNIKNDPKYIFAWLNSFILNILVGSDQQEFIHNFQDFG